MSRIEKIKLHVKEHKAVYITGGVCLLVGALGGAAYVSKNKMVDAKVIQGLAYKSPVTQTIEVWVEALGDPGNIIQDTTTGTIYASQGQAARELGVSAAGISKQLNGQTSHVNGHKFEKLGKAMVA